MLQGIDHVTVRCADLARSLAFYEGCLGLRQGRRPAFDVPGAWLYIADRPLLHLVADRAGGTAGPGLDHVAFRARRRATVEAALRAHGAACSLRPLPDASAFQLFVSDPDGARLELVFPSNEEDDA